MNLEIIKQYEGFSAKPYLCPAKVPTIGYGSTVYPDGSKVSMKDPFCTKEQAETWLLWHVQKHCLPHIKQFVRPQLNDNQISALASFIYNVGAGNFQTSTLLKKVNANPNDPTIANEFAKWNKAGGKVLSGLTERRKAEADLYFS